MGNNFYSCNVLNLSALDAYCLLMIYEAIYPLLKKHNLDLEKVTAAKSTPVKVKEELKPQNAIKTVRIFESS